MFKVIILIGIIALSACEYNGAESADIQIEDESLFTDANQTIVEVSLSYFVLEDVEKMTDLATHITRGAVIDVRTEWVDVAIPREVIVQDMLDEGMTQDEVDYELYGFEFEQDLQLMTIYSIQALESFQGDHIEGDVIEVMQLGGEYGDEI